MPLNEPIIRHADIQDRIDSLIPFFDDRTVLMPVMVGALPFVADIIRHHPVPMNIAHVIPVYASSYHGTEQADHVTVAFPSNVDKIAGEDVVIVEDIIDTGRTVGQILDSLVNYQPKSIQVVTLLDKPSRRVIDVEIDWSGFDVPDTFVVGYGMDHDGDYRALPDVWTLTDETT